MAVESPQHRPGQFRNIATDRATSTASSATVLPQPNRAVTPEAHDLSTHHPRFVPTPSVDDVLVRATRHALRDIEAFSRLMLPSRRLRPYQVAPARAIIESVTRQQGQSFAVVFSRQAGKDELLAQVLAFLLLRYQRAGGSVVVAAPTFRPQAALMRDRLLTVLREPVLAAFGGGKAEVRDGYAVALDRAAVRFLSAAPGANARGQTADLLLVANEAQDILPDIWDAVFDPMAASTNATTLWLGTVWSRETLLARQMAVLDAEERRDGLHRVWRVPWQDVAATLPAYGERVRARIAQFGVTHPFIRTEYCLEELDGDGGLFPPSRIAAMRGDHPRRHQAEPGKRCKYAILVDVAGEEEGASGPAAFRDDTRRDSTAVTVIEVDTEAARRQDGETARNDEDATVQHAVSSGRLAVSPTCRLPIYKVIDRQAWTGARHTALHGQVVHLAREVWRASVVVVDATGVGAGLASFLAAALGARQGGKAIPVIPFVFSAASKSALGWDWLGLIDAGRYREYADDGEQLTRLFYTQLAAVTYATPPGPGKALRWGVPPGRGHDDLVLSAALVAVLDGFDWRERRARGVAGNEGA
ncbi:MAG: hypothetical protein U0031_22205 [Thermomicrobiales bacterium]